MHYVVVEGLPAVGKSETLELLARFYSHRVRVLPELVKTLVDRHSIDLLRERDRLTEALRAALPERRRQVESILDQGFLCLEESHLGVHLAYAEALDDHGFVDTYASIHDALPCPDAYIRMEISIAESMARQRSRGTPRFDIDAPTLARMLSQLDRWHATRKTPLRCVDADRVPQAVVAEIADFLHLSYITSSDRTADAFDVLLLLGRPASGKSEFIDFMTKLPSSERAERFALGPLRILDDFPILWDLFEQDDLWESVRHERRWSKRCDENYAVTDDAVWGYLMEQLNRRAVPLLAAHPVGAMPFTILMEFSRGGPTGYYDALHRLSPEILKRAAALYISVSFDESWRRNVARYDQARRDGVLTHSVPREEMERTYGQDDWRSLTQDPLGTLRIRHVDLPYATLNNEPESKDPSILADRYRAALAPLYSLWRDRRRPG